jgi:hypothetical protein
MDKRNGKDEGEVKLEEEGWRGIGKRKGQKEGEEEG